MRFNFNSVEPTNFMNTGEQLNPAVRTEESQPFQSFLINLTQVLMFAPSPPLPVNTVNVIPSSSMSVYDVLYRRSGMLTSR